MRIVDVKLRLVVRPDVHHGDRGAAFAFVIGQACAWHQAPSGTDACGEHGESAVGRYIISGYIPGPIHLPLLLKLSNPLNQLVDMQ